MSENKAASSQSDKQFKQRLSQIYHKIKNASQFMTAMPEIEGSILEMLGAERITIYQCVRNGKEIVATFKSSKESREIKVPFSPTSIAGYVALSQRPVLIKDLYNDNELKKIHPKLQFDHAFSEKAGLQHRTMIAVPIKEGPVLLGVLQIINKTDGGAFSREDTHHAMHLAQIVGKKFHTELQSTQGPYDYLVQQKLISASELQQFEKQSQTNKLSISEQIHTKGISLDEIGTSLENYYQVPFMGYQETLNLPKLFFDDLKIPFLINNLWLPIAGTKEEVIILLDDPSDTDKIMEIQTIINADKYIFRVGLVEDILRYLNINAHNIDKPNMFDVVSKMEVKEQNKTVASPSEVAAGEDLNSALEASSPTVQLVNQLISETARMGGSDIHIEPAKNNEPGIVRVRVDGVCQELLKVPSNNMDAVVARIKVMSRLDLAERRIPQDGKCKLKVRGKELELRVATIPTVNGESVVMRLLAGGGALPLEKLNLSKENMANVLTLTTHPHGLFLVVGPTGSGKTTTLHAVLGHLNTTEKKIWTAEDPVEITQPGLQQVQINNKVGFDFAAAMRSFLRADPDIILIGEMRDSETAGIGIEASLTGHLVLSTLHTNSAPETITRLLELGMDPINFSDALLGILAQRLMRTLCSSCKQSYKPSQKEIAQLIHTYGEHDFSQLNISSEDIRLNKAVGCSKCNDTGYRGRTGIHELLVASDAMKKLVYKNASIEQLKAQATKDGMRTLLQDGVMKIIQGDSDYSQLMQVVAE